MIISAQQFDRGQGNTIEEIGIKKVLNFRELRTYERASYRI
ncbi:MAG: hypothetical protein ACK5C0_11575 [Candidatus Kapaibacterium sp.]|nr:hypothetical protein [Candidatus Kapabacteria bacterium]